MRNISPEEKCPRCDKSRTEWRSDNCEGVQIGDILYCCYGCALNIACHCAPLQYTPRLERNVSKEELLKTALIAILAVALFASPRIVGDELIGNANVASAQMTSTPAPHKHHHRLKKAHVTAASPNISNVRNTASDTDVPGLSDSLGTNNAGSPNMGSSDHTPGTTGTSGQ